MTSHDIRQAITDFLALLEHGRDTEADNIRRLIFVLDQLAFAAHFVDDTFEDDHSAPPSQDYAHFRTQAAQRFPSFGYYNLPRSITENITQTEVVVGDAIDDLADIAHDLATVDWCWTHTSENDALWHFQFHFAAHFGAHVRNLQWYIQALLTEQA
jgi:hypothetical protein